jgi:hypothetical protein
MFEIIDPAVFAGTVVRAVRDGGEYCGIIAFTVPDPSGLAGGVNRTDHASNADAVNAGGEQPRGASNGADTMMGVGGAPDVDSVLMQIGFGISSLEAVAEGRSQVARAGDEVLFQVATVMATGATRAVNVRVTQRHSAAPETVVVSEDKNSALVAVIKGSYGFLAHTVEGSGSDTL